MKFFLIATHSEIETKSHANLFYTICCYPSQRHEKQEMPLPPPRRKDLHMVPYGIRPVLQRTALEFLIWGVRNMQNFQLLAVDTPSVLIQVCERAK